MIIFCLQNEYRWVEKSGFNLLMELSSFKQNYWTLELIIISHRLWRTSLAFSLLQPPGPRLWTPPWTSKRALISLQFTSPLWNQKSNPFWQLKSRFLLRTLTTWGSCQMSTQLCDRHSTLNQPILVPGCRMKRRSPSRNLATFSVRLWIVSPASGKSLIEPLQKVSELQTFSHQPIYCSLRSICLTRVGLTMSLRLRACVTSTTIIMTRPLKDSVKNGKTEVLNLLPSPKGKSSSNSSKNSKSTPAPRTRLTTS